MFENPVFFVIGAPRSGSTWLLKLLNQHPDIFASENRFFGDFCEMWPNLHGDPSVRITLEHFVNFHMKGIDFESNPMKLGDFRHKLMNRYLSTIVDLSLQESRKRVFVDKINPYPGTTEAVFEGINRYFPSAKKIELLRDGRDVLTSLVFNWIAKTDLGKRRYHKYVEHQKLTLEKFFEESDFDKWMDYWLGPTSYFQNAPSASSLVVRYEDLHADASCELEKVFRLIGVEWGGGFLKNTVRSNEFSRMSGGRKRGDQDPVAHARKGIVGDWRNYFTSQDGQWFEEISNGLLVKTGYEQKHDWWKSLPDRLGDV